MRTFKFKICAALLALTIISGGVITAFADTAEEYSFEEQTCHMYKDGNGYRFVGPCGDSSEGFVNPGEVIPAQQSYNTINQSDEHTLVAVGGGDIPSSVDLSSNKYFPPVGDQSVLGSCACFSTVYYQFSYAMNEKRGIATTAENAASPMFVFNFLNAGGELGTRYEENYKFLEQHGAPPQSLVPYNTEDSLNWNADPGVWREASKYRLESYYEYENVGGPGKLISSADDPDITHYKTALASGKVLGFSTTIYTWKATTLKEHPDAPENKKYAGQYSVMYNDDASGEHRMAIVGYNDNIWTDINGNDKVDDGEMGAFKIVNSWGESYCNNGFVWVAYDALNYDQTTVSGGYSGYRNSVIHAVTSCEVREHGEGSDIYIEFTLNTNKRVQMEVDISGELNGTITKKQLFVDFSYQQTHNEGGFDGTQDACDGTFIYCLDNVIKELDEDNFEDYTWSITLRDNSEDSNPLTVKSLKLVNEATGKTYTPADVSAFSLDGSEREVFLKETSSTTKVIYYTGYYNPILNYKKDGGEFTAVKMENNPEREKYVNKFVIENCPEDLVLYFTDDKGNKDDNNGRFYTASERLNFYTTEGVGDKFEIRGTSFKNGEIDVDKLMKMVIDTVGGYEPYHYQMTIEELDTGKVSFKSYKYMWYIQEPGYIFKSMSGHKFTIEAMDHTGQTVTYETIIYPQDLPFEFVELKAGTEGALFVGDSIRFTSKSRNEGVFSHGLSKNIYEFTVTDSKGNVCYSVSKNNDFADYNERYSETFIDFVPAEKGEYTVKVVSTDLKKQTAEISSEFTVVDKIYGDANGDGAVDIKDATLVQKQLTGAGGNAYFYSGLSDCDGNGVLSIKDATCIRKYLAKLQGFNKAGQVIEYIPEVTEPATEIPTEPETEPVVTTVPEVKNEVTFTNSLNWSGTIYCYYWSNENKNMVSWPGVPMTNAGVNDFSQTLYTFEVPDGVTNIIFSNGNMQTVDIDYPGGELRYYAENVKSGNGYTVKLW